MRVRFEKIVEAGRLGFLGFLRERIEAEIWVLRNLCEFDQVHVGFGVSVLLLERARHLGRLAVVIIEAL